MTDVTGFGLFGHLIEMAEGSGLSAEIYYDKIPVADGLKEYISNEFFQMPPQGTGAAIAIK
jgi:selenide,water dikinase